MLCGAAIAAAACSSDDTKSPTAPTGIPTVAGTWAGQYHIKNCTDTVNGVPGTLCATVTDSSTATTPASTQPLQLTLTQQGDQVGGTLAFTGWYVQNVPVTGTIGTSGRLWLTGALTFTDPACPTTTGRVTVSAWVTDLNRERNELIGAFTLTGNRRLSACLFSNVAVDADTVDITRKAVTTTTTAGAS
jgi:hypothetical protein